MVEHLSFVDGLLARIEGPMHFRLILQPLVALFFGLRDGVRDAREKRSAYFWALFTEPPHRREMLGSGWKSIGKVFVIAVVLDFIFQFMVFRDFRPIGALLAMIEEGGGSAVSERHAALRASPASVQVIVGCSLTGASSHVAASLCVTRTAVTPSRTPLASYREKSAVAGRRWRVMTRSDDDVDVVAEVGRIVVDHLADGLDE